MNEIWILGATGRSGRAIAARLAASGAALVLVGRDAERLRELAATIGGTPRTVVADSVGAVAARLAAAGPAVVVNTIGPFTGTAVPLARACPPGSHYVDLANELSAVTGLLALHDEAAAAGRCLVTGAGFGVLGTESVVLKLCADRPAVTRVRVDALPMVEEEPGRIGSALAGSMVDALAGGGRRYEHGRLVRARLGGDFERFTLPDGSAAEAMGAPTGELEAARRATGAPFVVAGSGMVPAGRAIRAVLPVVAALLSLPPLGNSAKRRLARTRVTPRERTREFSWARARVEGSDGSVREGWMRTGEAMAFTSAVTAEVARRLAGGEGRPGAYTPGALFGPELAAKAGGQFLLGDAPTP
ncbi:saccharopine dehydrogenase NADP-binding domain-containing protein [Streptomyces sp. NBC_01476]|uniref:NAD(P)-binding domain-containing protein n=1 Tax=Streptomyces sp. NBC_01476 TaxID=2903881 RepID=UPI002E362F02|nr:NAD(P)-binding domain-containing protein [Streptomyces sp. NBC_01476]